MRLEIVWRNPAPTQKSKSSIRAVVHQEHVTVYFVSNAEYLDEFEVISGGAA